MRATVHNANKCTFDGRDCWIACLVDDHGRMVLDGDHISEHGTESEAIEWAAAQLKLRGVAPAHIDLGGGRVVRGDLPRRRAVSP